MKQKVRAQCIWTNGFIVRYYKLIDIPLKDRKEAHIGRIDAFPTDDSLFKMLYLAMNDITKKWTGRRQDWSSIYAQLVIYYGDRIPE